MKTTGVGERFALFGWAEVETTRMPRSRNRAGLRPLWVDLCLFVPIIFPPFLSLGVFVPWW